MITPVEIRVLWGSGSEGSLPVSTTESKNVIISVASQPMNTLKIQESLGVNPSPSVKPENKEHQCLRAEEDGGLSSRRKGGYLAFLCLLCSAPQWVNDAHLY
ncbi:TPA: hypothetical protein BOS_16294 [Bos taurus]|nr:TPA: hypothetical protein BOS_16294 [Bos taurus]